MSVFSACDCDQEESVKFDQQALYREMFERICKENLWVHLPNTKEVLRENGYHIPDVTCGS